MVLAHLAFVLHGGHSLFIVHFAAAQLVLACFQLVLKLKFFLSDLISLQLKVFKPHIHFIVNKVHNLILMLISQLFQTILADFQVLHNTSHIFEKVSLKVFLYFFNVGVIAFCQMLHFGSVGFMQSFGLTLEISFDSINHFLV